MPESRLKEQFFGAPSANTSFSDEQGERTFVLLPVEVNCPYCLVSENNEFDIKGK